MPASNDPWRVLFVLPPHFSMMSFTAAADVLVTANLEASTSQFSIDTLALAGSSVVSDLGIDVATRYALDHRPAFDADLLVVVGGYRCSLQPNSALTALLTQAEARGTELAGLWNGVVPLAEAGLLDQHDCTVHNDNRQWFAERFPHVRLQERPLVIDRQRLSAAGPNSSLDLMLAMVQRHCDAGLVAAIRRILRADLSMPDATVEALQRDHERELPDALQRAIRIMRNSLDHTLARDELANRLNLSTRAVERLFKLHLQTSPGRFHQQLRLRRSHELLCLGTLPINRIALDCGFVSAAHFSRAFRAHFRQTPRSARDNARAQQRSPTA